MTLMISRRTALCLAAGAALGAHRMNALSKTGESAMSNAAKKLATEYLDAWKKKNIDSIVKCLSPQIRFKSPNATTNGIESYTMAARRFFSLFESIEVRAMFISDAQAMFALDFNCVPPIGVCPTAELITYKDGLIVEDELFFDARPFEAMMRSHAANSAKS